jgi:hypothetical protein
MVAACATSVAGDTTRLGEDAKTRNARAGPAVIVRSGATRNELVGVVARDGFVYRGRAS